MKGLQWGSTLALRTMDPPIIQVEIPTVLSGLKNGTTQDSDSVHSPVSFQNRNSKDGERIEKTSKGEGKTTMRQRKQG